MKKLVFFAAIAAVVLSSCSSQSGRRKEKMDILIEKVAAMTIDSCQYDISGDIIYFSGGDTVIKRQEFCISTQDTVIYQTDVYTTITNLLTDKCPTPESYASVCLRHFKQVIHTQPLDSSYVVHGYDGDYYNFYLPSYKITISLTGYVKFESKGEIFVSTINSSGESVFEFSSGVANWSYDQQKEILDLLLEKESKQ